MLKNAPMFKRIDPKLKVQPPLDTVLFPNSFYYGSQADNPFATQTKSVPVGVGGRGRAVAARAKAKAAGS